MNQLLKTTAFLFFIIFNFNCNAFEMQSASVFDSNNDIKQVLSITCNQNENFCLNTCNQKNNCQISETMCEDCISITEQVVYSAFTEITTYLNTVFSTSLNQNIISHFLKTRTFISLTHNSFLNYFTPEEQLNIKDMFDKLCFIKNPKKSFLLAHVSGAKKIEAIVAIVCVDQNNQTVVFPMINNPNVQHQQSNYWQNLVSEITQIAEPQLKLKLSSELQPLSNDPQTTMPESIGASAFKKATSHKCKKIKNSKVGYVCIDNNGVKSYSDTGVFTEIKPITSDIDSFMRGVRELYQNK